MSGKEIGRRSFVKTALAGIGLFAVSTACDRKQNDRLILAGGGIQEEKPEKVEIVEFKHVSKASEEFFNALRQKSLIDIWNTCRVKGKTYYPEELTFEDECELFNQMPWGSSVGGNLVQGGMEVFYELNQKMIKSFGSLVFSCPQTVRESIEDRSAKYNCDVSARNRGFPAQGYWEACYELKYNYKQKPVSQDRKMICWVDVEMIPNPEDKRMPYQVRLYPKQISYASYDPQDLFQNLNVLISIGEEHQKAGHLPSSVFQTAYEYYSKYGLV